MAEQRGYANALRHSARLAREHLAAVVIFVLVIMALNAVVMGVSCGLGAAVSLPFTMLATIRLYHQLTHTPPPDASIRPPRSSGPA